MEMQSPISSSFGWGLDLLGFPLLSRKHSRLLSPPVTRTPKMAPEVFREHVEDPAALKPCPGICWLHLVSRRPENAVPIVETLAVADSRLAAAHSCEKQWHLPRTESLDRGSVCPIQSATLEPNWKTGPVCDLLHSFVGCVCVGLLNDANIALVVWGALRFQ
jgi:hypothetical protein